MSPTTTATTSWRFGTKIVAVGDLVLWSIGLFVFIVCVIAFAGITASAVNNEKDILDSSMNAAFLVIVWGILVIVALFACAEIWAAWKLMGASEVGIECKEALGNARIWRNANIVFMVLSIIGIIITFICLCVSFSYQLVLLLDIIFSLVVIGWRAGVFVVVCNYMQELENIVTNQSTNCGLNNIPV